MTTVTDGLYQYGGVPVGGMFTPGKAFFVRPSTGNDSNNGKSPNKAFATLSKALSMTTANKGDVVYLIAESNTASSTTDYQSTALDWNKDGVHLIGIGAAPFIGQRSRISNLSTATAIVDGLFILSADNCVIRNIEIFHGQGGTNPTGASIAMLVSGQRNLIENCQISGIGHSELDDANSRSLKVTGAENTFRHCYLGLDTVIRGTAAAEVEVGDIARTVFEDCMFNTYTSAAGFYILNYSAPDRFILLKNCTFSAINNITSAVAPTAALPASGSVNGQIMIHNSAFFGFGNVTAADAARVLVSAPAGGLVDMALASAVDVA